MDIMRSVGIMVKEQGFFSLSKYKHNVIQTWACDEFIVEHIIKNNQLRFIITFKTCFGEVIIDEWSMQILPKLAREVNGISVLMQMLVELNIKCSASREATIAILNVIQQPRLVFDGFNYGS